MDRTVVIGADAYKQLAYRFWRIRESVGPTVRLSQKEAYPLPPPHSSFLRPSRSADGPRSGKYTGLHWAGIKELFVISRVFRERSLGLALGCEANYLFYKRLCCPRPASNCFQESVLTRNRAHEEWNRRA